MFRFLIGSLLLLLSQTYAKNTVPSIYQKVAKFHGMTATKLYSEATAHASITKNGQIIVWPWVVEKHGQKIRFSNQRMLIEFIKQQPSFKGLFVGAFRIDITHAKFTDAILLTRPEVNAHAWVVLNHKHAYKAQKKYRRKTPLFQMIDGIAKKQGLDPRLVHAVIKQESAYRTNAISHAGAVGLMQIMPATGKDLGLHSKSDLLNPYKNVDAGVRYLKAQLITFKSLDKALAAYNAGPGAVRKYRGIPPYKETQKYVKRILADYKKRTKQVGHG